MKSYSANLGDIYRKEVFPRDRTVYSRLYVTLRNASEFLFHLLEATIKVLGVRTPREYLNLVPGLSFSVFTREGRITGAYVSLMDRIDHLVRDSLSFYYNFSM